MTSPQESFVRCTEEDCDAELPAVPWLVYVDRKTSTAVRPVCDTCIEKHEPVR